MDINGRLKTLMNRIAKNEPIIDEVFTSRLTPRLTALGLKSFSVGINRETGEIFVNGEPGKEPFLSIVLEEVERRIKEKLGER